MKHTSIIVFVIFTLNSFALASIESSELLSNNEAAEIKRNRACFRELEILGCGDPGEDLERFRFCMNNAFEALPNSCKMLMKDLYR